MDIPDAAASASCDMPLMRRKCFSFSLVSLFVFNRYRMDLKFLYCLIPGAKIADNCKLMKRDGKGRCK
jgi:hypothetical protein